MLTLLTMHLFAAIGPRMPSQHLITRPRHLELPGVGAWLRDIGVEIEKIQFRSSVMVI